MTPEARDCTWRHRGTPQNVIVPLMPGGHPLVSKASRKSQGAQEGSRKTENNDNHEQRPPVAATVAVPNLALLKQILKWLEGKPGSQCEDQKKLSESCRERGASKGAHAEANPNKNLLKWLDGLNVELMVGNVVIRFSWRL